MPEDSRLFQLIGGETVRIRYNPGDPEQFYCRDLLKTRVHTAVKTACLILFFAVLLIGSAWLKASSHSHVR